jgi:anhydro-N-acetylmuramic acid kinase
MAAKIWTALGSISGTSMDGIDVSVIETDGQRHVVAGPGATYPYPAQLRADLQAFLKNPEHAEHNPLADLETAVTTAHISAMAAFMQTHGLGANNLDLVGMHGQTVWHNPARRFTRQLGLGAVAARQLGVDTVGDFRQADIAAGGQGAPLAPLFHQALATQLEPPVMVLNWGGVGNVTYIDGTTVIAFDTGPASALLDDWMLRRRGVAFDDNGQLASSGQVHEATLAALMQNPYFTQPAPKSLDRQEFHRRAKCVETLSDADGAATLSAFTVEATAAALAHVPRRPTRWLVAGGGRLNGDLMQRLATRLNVPVAPVEEVGWNGDFLEAQCFGYLAVRSVLGLPLSLPTTTGVPQPMTGGVLSKYRA